jgi:hypothetical protein
MRAIQLDFMLLHVVIIGIGTVCMYCGVTVDPQDFLPHLLSTSFAPGCLYEEVNTNRNATIARVDCYASANSQSIGWYTCYSSGARRSESMHEIMNSFLCVREDERLYILGMRMRVTISSRNGTANLDILNNNAYSLRR